MLHATGILDSNERMSYSGRPQPQALTCKHSILYRIQMLLFGICYNIHSFFLWSQRCAHQKMGLHGALVYMVVSKFRNSVSTGPSSALCL